MRTADYLRDMLTYIQRIEETASEGEDAFYADYRIQDAVIRQYEVIGEIAKRLPAFLLDSQPEVDWRAIKGFRDFLAHNYDKIELEVVWGAVQKLPLLRKAVENLFNSLPSDDKTREEI